MREVGSTFIYKGEVLIAAKQHNACHGCVLSIRSGNGCVLGGQTKANCGTMAEGVVFVRSLEEFAAHLVAEKLTKE